MDVFTLDETEARSLIARALRRYQDGEDAGPPTYETLTIEPMWDPIMDPDEEGRVADLVYAARVCGAITAPEGIDVEFTYMADSDGGMYQWEVSVRDPWLKIASYPQEFRKLGFRDWKGSRQAMAILREGVAYANQIVDAARTLRLLRPDPYPYQPSIRILVYGYAFRPSRPGRHATSEPWRGTRATNPSQRRHRCQSSPYPAHRRGAGLERGHRPRASRRLRHQRHARHRDPRRDDSTRRAPRPERTRRAGCGVILTWPPGPTRRTRSTSWPRPSAPGTSCAADRTSPTPGRYGPAASRGRALTQAGPRNFWDRHGRVPTVTEYRDAMRGERRIAGEEMTDHGELAGNDRDAIRPGPSGASTQAAARPAGFPVSRGDDEGGAPRAEADKRRAEAEKRKRESVTCPLGTLDMFATDEP